MYRELTVEDEKLTQVLRTLVSGNVNIHQLVPNPDNTFKLVISTLDLKSEDSTKDEENVE